MTGSAELVPPAIMDEATRSAWPPDRTHHYTITLDDASVTALRAFGGGNLSAGIRRAALRLAAAGFVA